MTRHAMALLEIDRLRTEFATRDGVFAAVDDLSLQVQAGEIVGLVGESGSGKSVTGFSVLGLVDPPGRIAHGSIRFQGEELVGAPEEALRRATNRFSDRFHLVEAGAVQQGRTLTDMTLTEMDQLWEEAKQRLNESPPHASQLHGDLTS